MNTECRHCEDVNAYLAGELCPRGEAEFSTHLASCPVCCAAVESSRCLLTRLRATPMPEPVRDLAPEILSRIHRIPALQDTPYHTSWWQIAVGAAAVLVTLCSGWLLREHTPEKVLDNGMVTASAADTPAAAERVARALDWLVRTQETDGSWDPARWGGQRNYAPALTALPLLALVTFEEADRERHAAIQRAAANLLRLQNADGSFGYSSQGSSYNTSIATFALLQTWQRNPSHVPKPALDAAIATLLKQQATGGGTQWHVQALELARRLGWDEARKAADLMQAVIARPERPPGTTHDVLNFHRAYFSTTELRNHCQDATALARLRTIQHEILRLQSTEGDENGSWPPDDEWGRVGGRLYSTALASLSLTNLR